MYNLLQQHGAKQICKVPDGLPELCSDISREILRAQPTQVLKFIADYLDVLLLTRENAKIAVKLVDRITADGESIVNLLNRCGLNFKQILGIAPTLQQAFHDYLDGTDCICSIRNEPCIDDICSEENEMSIRRIIESTGVTLEAANEAARIIQKAFLNHYKRVTQTKITNEPIWERTIANTIDILRNAGLTQAEAIKTAESIRSTYQNYYSRLDEIKSQEGNEGTGVAGKKNGSFSRSKESVQAVAWLNMMYEATGITAEQTNRAATIIQHAYRQYRSQKKPSLRLRACMSTSSTVARTILDNLDLRVFQQVEAIQEDAKPTEKLSNVYERSSKTSTDSITNDVTAEMEEIIEQESDHSHY